MTLSLETVHGHFDYVGEIDQLSIPVEFMVFCPRCQDERRFYADRICASGLVGKCTHCGDERVAPFTRTMAGVA